MSDEYNKAKELMEENDYMIDGFGGASETIIKKSTNGSRCGIS
ncbi:hypothetical protein VL806_14790 [Listeria seeligeri]|nr:hypothetical protein [Listeria seeligeri]